MEVHLAVCASIPKAPNHSGNHALEVEMEGELAGEYPTAEAWQCTEFP